MELSDLSFLRVCDRVFICLTFVLNHTDLYEEWPDYPLYRKLPKNVELTPSVWHNASIVEAPMLIMLFLFANLNQSPDPRNVLNNFVNTTISQNNKCRNLLHAKQWYDFLKCARSNRLIPNLTNAVIAKRMVCVYIHFCFYFCVFVCDSTQTTLYLQNSNLLNLNNFKAYDIYEILKYWYKKMKSKCEKAAMDLISAATKELMTWNMTLSRSSEVVSAHAMSAISDTVAIYQLWCKGARNILKQCDSDRSIYKFWLVMFNQELDVLKAEKLHVLKYIIKLHSKQAGNTPIIPINQHSESQAIRELTTRGVHSTRNEIDTLFDDVDKLPSFWKEVTADEQLKRLAPMYTAAMNLKLRSESMQTDSFENFLPLTAQSENSVNDWNQNNQIGNLDPASIVADINQQTAANNIESQLMDVNHNPFDLLDTININEHIKKNINWHPQPHSNFPTLYDPFAPMDKPYQENKDNLCQWDIHHIMALIYILSEVSALLQASYKEYDITDIENDAELLNNINEWRKQLRSGEDNDSNKLHFDCFDSHKRRPAAFRKLTNASQVILGNLLVNNRACASMLPSMGTNDSSAEAIQDNVIDLFLAFPRFESQILQRCEDDVIEPGTVSFQSLKQCLEAIKLASNIAKMFFVMVCLLMYVESHCFVVYLWSFCCVLHFRQKILTKIAVKL